MSRQALKNIRRLLDEVENTTPAELSFLADLKRSIELTEIKHTRKPSMTYKPSGMNCIRSMYYQVIGEEPDKKDVSSCLVGICESGTDRHERIQNAVAQMKDNGFDCEYVDVAEYVRTRNLDYLDIVDEHQGNECKLFNRNLNMSFLCDGIIRYKKKYYIIEFKTESIYKWSTRQEVNPDHYNQAIAYSESLQIPEVLFVYINRDNTDMKAFMYEVTDDMRKKLVDRIKLCDEFVNEKKVPDKEESRKNCTYCLYKQKCNADG